MCALPCRKSVMPLAGILYSFSGVFRATVRRLTTVTTLKSFSVCITGSVAGYLEKIAELLAAALLKGYMGRMCLGNRTFRPGNRKNCHDQRCTTQPNAILHLRPGAAAMDHP